MTYNIEFLKPMTYARNGSCISMSSIETIVEKTAYHVILRAHFEWVPLSESKKSYDVWILLR